MEKLDPSEHLIGKRLEDRAWDGLRAAGLLVLVEVQREQLEDQADVPTKGKVLVQGDEVLAVLLVLGERAEDLDLDLALLVDQRQVAQDLHCFQGLLLVVEGLDHLAVGAPAEDLEDLVSVAQVVVFDEDVVRPVVVKAVVGQGRVAFELVDFGSDIINASEA